MPTFRAERRRRCPQAADRAQRGGVHDGHAEPMDSALRLLMDSRRHVITAAAATELGVLPRELRSLVAIGELFQLCRGAYVDGPVFRAASSEGQHCLRARGVLAMLPSGMALSHHSAAVAWSLPWLGTVPRRVHLVREGPGQHRRSATHTIHRTLPSVRIQERDGLKVVEPAYAILGVAGEHGLRHTVAALDAGLHTGLVHSSRVEEMLSVCAGWPGHDVVRAATALTDPHAESPGESLTRLLLLNLGYSVRSQVEIRATGPAFSARVDFLLESHRVVIEFDGLKKYGAADGSADRGALVREKAREDQLRALGYEVVRLVWADLQQPEKVRALLEAACRRATRVA